MGRAITLIVFFVAFLVFAGLKAAGSGVKKAYHAVFNPNAQEAEAFIAELQGSVGSFLISGDQDLTVRHAELRALVDSAQRTGRRHGFEIPREQVKDIVAQSLAAQGAGPDYRVRTLLDSV